MFRLLRWLLGGVLALIVVLGAVSVAARFADGPLAIFAGGAFTSGERHEGALPDWAFLADRETVEFQSLEPERSRTSWVVAHDGRAFIPSGYMTTSWGKLWKQWPHEILADPRILLRIDDVVYPATLTRITEGDILTPVLTKLGNKYANGPIPPEAVSSGYLWIFEVTPR